MSHRWSARLRAFDPVRRTGRVNAIRTTVVEADGPNVPLGTLCEIEARGAGSAMLAEVVAVDTQRVMLAPLEQGLVTYAGATVTALPASDRIAAGPALLGRVLDALGRPLDGRPAAPAHELHPLEAPLPSPLERASPRQIFETGVRAIDGVLTLGEGQRVGIFAAAGVGKTSLIAQIARQAEADVTIIALIGERGREVDALWHDGLDVAARARSTLIAATSDQPAALRARAAFQALALADYWRARGKHVLLLLDSATRLAMALREIGLAAGEPPTVRAYTPNVFATMPRLVERCGALRSGGAITAIVTVLSETDAGDDPIAEMMKSLLDGHLMLSRALSEQGHFPAIDICRSVSRQAEGLVGDRQAGQARRLVQWLSLHEASRTLRESGLYVPGQDAATDRALERHAAVMEFLRQDRRQHVLLAETHRRLDAVAGDAT
ncbi:FliI/YscN family ATPase [Flavisphingomonas formosensis]|uniref:FliI/YscN family ATPase n=1 Tax=Flavisphingomonas formosensis TaxID=861534 RepID=UPI0012FC088F|nr:FliI/YscN family ATPase [Sphingomonas formosensis]